MKNYIFLLILLCCVSCIKDPVDDHKRLIDPIEIFDFETKTTHTDSVAFFVEDQAEYTSFSSRLNDQEVDLFSIFSITQTGYFELEIEAKKGNEDIDLFFQFVIIDSDRGGAEWGVRKFTPQPFAAQPISLSEFKFTYPKTYPSDISLPIIFNSTSAKSEWGDYYDHISIDGHKTTIKRGIGSILLTPDRSSNAIQASTNLGTQNLDITDVTPNYTVLEGTISSSELKENGFYHIPADITLSSSGTFEIPQGCIFKIDEGVNITNEGELRIIGSETQPIVFTCSDENSFWGGFISDGSNTSIVVEHAIFTKSGFNDSEEYQYGHAKRQALFFHKNSVLDIRNSYIIDNIGQIIYAGNDLDLTVENVLIQRAKTIGEISNSDIEISNSIFTDFPTYSTEYLDEDNDCLYLGKCNAVISNSTFMWSKDDGIDSGGSSGGHIEIDNCYFEGIFHEAIALSSGGSVTKNHTISNSTFVNNGQGVELGYSSPNHNVSVSNCHFDKNMIGVRYGDNYDAQVSGKMELLQCTFGENHDKDIWNFVRSEWGPKDENLVY